MDQAAANPTTRRMMLLGVAVALPSVALARVPAVALGAADTDPIFAVIERQRQIEAAYVAACNTTVDQLTEDWANELCHRSIAALADLVATTPTTLAGCAAVLRYVEAHTRDYEQGGLFEDYPDVEKPAADFLSRIAATLDAAVHAPMAGIA